MSRPESPETSVELHRSAKRVFSRAGHVHIEQLRLDGQRVVVELSGVAHLGLHFLDRAIALHEIEELLSRPLQLVDHFHDLVDLFVELLHQGDLRFDVSKGSRRVRIFQHGQLRLQRLFAELDAYCVVTG